MNRVCRNCRQPNPPDAAFCLNCATPLAGGQPNNQQWNQPHFAGRQAGQNFAPNAAGGASQRATAALILAAAGLFCCGPFTSVPAMFVGWMEVDAIKKGQSPAGGMWMAQVGLWGGGAITVIQIVGFLFWMLLSIASSPYGY